MITETTGRDEVAAMNAKYEEVLVWEAEFAAEIQASKKTYREKSEGSRYIVTVVGYKNLRKVYRIWDRQEKKHIGETYTAKRKAQNAIDSMMTEY
ncbi:hypothetical protein [Paenibacillus sp. FSL H3-0286]|uniref:hypothetical protein n=1 Tax=Paenibacillus sp. FSL H3-0286 TaxID=2921427 RepID=UPI00324DBB62